jgi:uncharacterized membrane protein YkoI
MTDFLSRFRSEVIEETLKVGDTVIISGRDEFKGFKGTVVSLKSISGETRYSIELEANGKKIERKIDSLNKSYSN